MQRRCQRRAVLLRQVVKGAAVSPRRRGDWTASKSRVSDQSPASKSSLGVRLLNREYRAASSLTEIGGGLLRAPRSHSLRKWPRRTAAISRLHQEPRGPVSRSARRSPSAQCMSCFGATGFHDALRRRCRWIWIRSAIDWSTLAEEGYDIALRITPGTGPNLVAGPAPIREN